MQLKSVDESSVWVQSDVVVGLTGPVHTFTLKLIGSLVDIVITGVNPPGLMSQAKSWWSQVLLSTSVACECKCVSDCKSLVFTQHAKPENSACVPSEFSSLYILIIMTHFLSFVFPIRMWVCLCFLCSSMSSGLNIFNEKWVENQKSDHQKSYKNETYSNVGVQQVSHRLY